MREHDTAGQEITPPFFSPCPKRCGSTGGCESCRVGFRQNNSWTLPVGTFPFGINADHREELTPEEEKRFYDKVFKHNKL